MKSYKNTKVKKAKLDKRSFMVRAVAIICAIRMAASAFAMFLR